MQIYVYQDYIHNNGTLYRSLCRHFGTDAVSFCDAADIIDGALDAHGIKMFVMPGGADLYYTEKLNGAGNAAIRAYVENGGIYLGICAGAYYGCTELRWAVGTDQEVSGPRELAFFPGAAVGPVHDFIEEGDVTKSWRAAPVLSFDTGKEIIDCRVNYEGGPVFVPTENTDDYKTIARYDSLPGQPAAIVECTVGRGKAVLCSPHLESSAEDLSCRLYRLFNNSYDWDRAVAHALQPDETTQRQLWTKLMERCLA